MRSETYKSETNAEPCSLDLVAPAPLGARWTHSSQAYAIDGMLGMSTDCGSTFDRRAVALVTDGLGSTGLEWTDNERLLGEPRTAGFVVLAVRPKAALTIGGSSTNRKDNVANFRVAVGRPSPCKVLSEGGVCQDVSHRRPSRAIRPCAVSASTYLNRYGQCSRCCRSR